MREESKKDEEAIRLSVTKCGECFFAVKLYYIQLIKLLKILVVVLN